MSLQNSDSKQSRPPEDLAWYFCCEVCDKLYFAPTEWASCPRCGHENESHDYRELPWTGGQDEV